MSNTKTYWSKLFSESKNNTFDNIYDAITANSKFIKYANFDKLNQDEYVKLFRYAIEKNIMTFNYLDEHKLPLSVYHEFCLFVVKRDGSMITKIPDKIITHEIIMAAIRQDGLILEFIIDTINDNDLLAKYCVEAVISNCRALALIPNYIAEKYYTDLCREAIKADGSAIKYITLDEISQEYINLAKRAVSMDGLLIRYIKNKTPELCMMAVKQNGLAIQFIDNDIITKSLEILEESIVMQAVKTNPKALKYVSVEFQSDDVIHEALSNDIDSIKYVNKSLINNIRLKLKDVTFYYDQDNSHSKQNKSSTNQLNNKISDTFTEDEMNQIFPSTITEEELNFRVSVPHTHCRKDGVPIEKRLQNAYTNNIELVDSIDKMIETGKHYYIQNNNKYSVYIVEQKTIVDNGWFLKTSRVETQRKLVGVWTMLK